MIFIYRARLVILSQPKTGTTALDNALAHRASVVINNPPEMKHINYKKFMKFMAPFIKAQTGLAREDYQVCSVMREPLDWLGSWYRYRTRDQLKKANHNRAQNYTGDVSFDAFLEEVLKPKGQKPSYAQVGSPCAVARKANGAIGCDYIFPYEDTSGLYALIEERTGKPVETKQMNVSPEMTLEVSDAIKAKIYAKYAFETDLHGSLRRDGQIDDRFRVALSEDDDDDTNV